MLPAAAPGTAAASRGSRFRLLLLPQQRLRPLTHLRGGASSPHSSPLPITSTLPRRFRSWREAALVQTAPPRESWFRSSLVSSAVVVRGRAMLTTTPDKLAPAAPESRYSRRRDESEEDDSDGSDNGRGHDERGKHTSGSGEENDTPSSSSAAGADEEGGVSELAKRIKGTRLSEEEEEANEKRDADEREEQGRAEIKGRLLDVESASSGLRRVAQWLQQEERRQGVRRNVVVLSGAGVSCSAGIPDFRSPGTGLYDNLQKYNLPYPEAIFDLNFYRRNVDPFVSLASEIWPGLRYSPTLTHSFVALLDRKGVLLRNYTQNIDGLELLGGVSEDRVVECHGHFRTAKCVNCFKPHGGEECRREMVDDKRAPRCGRCGGPVKPDIVFFGEELPDRFGRLLRRDVEKADMIVVMGTSLTVAPVSMIPEMVGYRCQRVLLNNELVGDFSPPGGRTRRFFGRAQARAHEDVFEEGDCDASVLRLCRMLGWEDELLELNSASRLDGGQR